MNRGSYADVDTTDEFLDSPDLAYRGGKSWEQRIAAQGHDGSDLSTLADDISRRRGVEKLELPPRVEH